MTYSLWNSKHISLSFNQDDILNAIMDLHNNSKPFELDPTYSKGNFYKNIPKPKLKFDINSQSKDVYISDCRKLPLQSESIESIMFDPPFVVAPSAKPGIIRDRFSCYKNIDELWTFYKDSLIEFFRLLKPNGIVVFKNQDIVSGGINYMTHAQVIYIAQQIGFYVKDLFVLGRKNILWSPNMANQQHARKNHCYFLVLQKLTHNNRKCILSNITKINP